MHHFVGAIINRPETLISKQTLVGGYYPPLRTIHRQI